MRPKCVLLERRGAASLQLGNFAAAVADFESTCKLSPDNDAVARERDRAAELLERLGKGDDAKLFEAAQQCVLAQLPCCVVSAPIELHRALQAAGRGADCPGVPIAHGSAADQPIQRGVWRAGLLAALRAPLL